MRVQDIMQGGVRWCSPRATLATAGTMMAEAECGFLPVVENGRVIGVVTDRDISLSLRGSTAARRWSRCERS